MTTPQRHPQESVDVNYETTSILHITQFLLSATGEDVVIDCSCGAVSDPATGRLTVPVHSRIALPWSVAERLVKSLNQAIANQRQQSAPVRTPPPHTAPATSAATRPAPSAHASLPRFDDSTA